MQQPRTSVERSAVEESEGLGVRCKLVECETALLKVGTQVVERVASRDAAMPVNAVGPPEGDRASVEHEDERRTSDADEPSCLLGREVVGCPG